MTTSDATPVGAPQQRPNFVVLMTDDQGPWAMPHLMPELHMPALQQLLAESLEFTHAYCASPVCSPSRASVLTGRIPSAHGIHDFLVGDRNPNALPDHYLDGQPSTPELLARHGYQCAHSGKWHLGDSRLPGPGFEWWYAHRYGGGPYYDAPIWRNGVATTQPGYLTDAITEQAVTYLRKRDTERPFYLQVNYTAPHTPWIDNHPTDLRDFYADTVFPSVAGDAPHPWARPRHEWVDALANPVAHITGYCAALSGVDRGLARIRAELDRAGVADSTIIIYLSDNGFSCGQHGIWGKGNGTFPLNFWDNSVRVPLVVHSPGGPTGTTGRLTSTRELHETLCELAGVTPDPDIWRPPGSFAGVLRGDNSGPTTEYAVVTAEYGQGRMITDGRHVRIVRSTGPAELYDHETDPGERTNLAGDPAHTAIQRQLDDALADWYTTYVRPGYDAYNRPVTGLGQIHPVSRGRNDPETYAPATWDSSENGDADGLSTYEPANEAGVPIEQPVD